MRRKTSRCALRACVLMVNGHMGHRQEMSTFLFDNIGPAVAQRQSGDGKRDLICLLVLTASQVFSMKQPFTDLRK